jgi:hypothetical protein
MEIITQKQKRAETQLGSPRSHLESLRVPWTMEQGMEGFFAPTRRFLSAKQGPGIGESISCIDLTEVELLTEKQEEILVKEYTWTDFLSFIHDKLVWVAPKVFVSSNTNHDRWLGSRYRSLLTVQTVSDLGRVQFDLAVWAGSVVQANAACDWIFRLLATSQAPEIRIECHGGRPLIPVSTRTLSYFLSTIKSARVLCVWMFALSEEHVRALAETDHTNLLVKLTYCDLSDAETNNTILAQLLRTSQARLELVSCVVAGDVLVGALKGNSCVRLTPSQGDEGLSHREIHTLLSI